MPYIDSVLLLLYIRADERHTSCDEEAESLHFPPRAFSYFSSSQLTFGTQGKFPTTFVCLLALITHYKALRGQLQISAARVKINVEQFFERWLDMKEDSDEYDCRRESG